MEARFPAMVKEYMGPQIQQQMGLSLDQFISKGNSLGFYAAAINRYSS
jgi:putative ABC transport system permease protein